MLEVTMRKLYLHGDEAADAEDPDTWLGPDKELKLTKAQWSFAA